MSLLVNCDMGEGFGMWRLGDDAALMAQVDLANVACGFHAGDPVVMASTVALAGQHGVGVGAHPSYPDLQGFGRRAMEMDPGELRAAVLYQVGALRAFLDAEGLALSHVKPHGALYGRAARDPDVAGAVADAAAVFGVPVMGMAGTVHEEVYGARGLEFWPEFYADLDYDDDGSLVITRTHERLDPAVVRRRVERVLADGVAETRTGALIPMRATCICIHSDTPGAPAILARVRAELEAAGVAIRAFGRS